MAEAVELAASVIAIIDLFHRCRECDGRHHTPSWRHCRNAELRASPRPSTFPQPDDFIPERWLEGHEMSRGINLDDANAALTPYNVGSRSYMGQTLTKTELYLTVPRLVRQLDFRLSSEMKADDMYMKDLWAVQPKGRRLLLDIKPVDE